MFDQIHIGGGSHHHRHEITEKRAPTDESVRLLREMEEAAEKRVIERGALKDNLLEAQWVLIWNPAGGPDDADLHLRFLLNGDMKHIKVRVNIHHYQNPQTKLHHIYARFTEALAEELFKGLLQSPVVNDLFPKRLR